MLPVVPAPHLGSGLALNPALALTISLALAGTLALACLFVFQNHSERSGGPAGPGFPECPMREDWVVTAMRSVSGFSPKIQCFLCMLS